MSTFFEKLSELSARGSKEFSLKNWEEQRDAVIPPLFHSGYASFEQNRQEFLTGADLLGFLSEGQEVKPQQLAISDTLALPKSAYVIEIPRRASKTTSIFLTLLGRCASRPNYKVTYSAQSGIAGSAQFLDWVMQLNDATPPDDLDLPPWLRNQVRSKTKSQQRFEALFGDDILEDSAPGLTGGRGFRIMKGEVNKGIYFDNGSSFTVLRPDAKAYRGKAADVSWIDEAQEIPVEEGDALLAAIRPLQDTRPGASIIISGTAGEARVGIFWDYLERGRNQDPNVGIIDYAAPEETPWEDIEDETRAMDLIARTHPGIGTLTTLETMRERYNELPKPQWAREYLSIWPETYGVVAIPADQWEDAAQQRKVAIPPRVAFGMAIKPGGAVASIVAAWRNSKGKAYIEVVEHRQGTSWIPKRAQELTSKYRGSSIAYDDIAEGKATATEALMLSPRPRFRIQTYRENAAGCVQLMRDLERGHLTHFDQVGLNDAVMRAAKREVRGDQGIWLWTVGQPSDDITCLDAATRALRNWDQHFAKSPSSRGPVIAE